MEKQPLVSMIVPCYNCEKWIGRLIESVISQTYDNIELIVVNDGSTDRSGEIIDFYEQKVTDRGYKFKSIHQENKGLGGAINAGLKVFCGEYLCWLDADDYLEPTSVEDRVKVLIENPDFAIVTSNAYIRKSDDLENFTLLVTDEQDQKQEWQFEKLLNGPGSIFCSGCHMVRTESFLDVNPEREIYPARRGQNWQMLLPIYFKYKRYYLHKPLYNYVVYKESMSRGDNTEKTMLERYNEHEILLKHTLKNIEQNQGKRMSKYYDFVVDKYFKLKLKTSLDYNDRERFFKEYAEKQEIADIDFFDTFLSFCMKNRVCKLLYRIFNRLFTKACEVETVVAKKLTRTKNKETQTDALVTIIVPCFNGENYLRDCFQSVYRQSYKHIELIVVNDGSTDNSERIILEHKELIESKGYSFHYIKQNNQGAAGAVNNALKQVHGKYLMLFDVDDVLFRNAVSEKVNFLEKNLEYGMVRNNGYYVNNTKSIGKNLFINTKKEMKNEFIFNNLLTGKTNNWPGSFMVRTSVLFNALRGRDIYVSHYGQNLQVMLPVAYKTKTGFINKPLMKYYVHIGSHSHSKDHKRTIECSYGYEKNRYKILEQIGITGKDLEKTKSIIKQQFTKNRLNQALTWKSKELFVSELSEYKGNKILYKLLWALSCVKVLSLINFFKKAVMFAQRNILNLKQRIVYLEKNRTY